jgi:cobalt/nickel transport system ATP-binding protein
MLRLEDVVFSYEKGTEIIKGINIEIEEGKKIVFLGENGSGKSTLFLIMNGLLKPEKGNMYFKGKKVEYKRKELDKLREKVGIVFQDPEIQIFAPTVMQEVAFGLKNLGYSSEKTEERALEAMRAIEIENLKDTPCHHLSYGQKKRVAIASITAMKPEILILDEPLAWLDPKNKKRILEILLNFSKEGKTMVVSTHDVNFAYDFADYIFVLRDGKVLKSGDKKEVFSDFEFLKKANLDVPTVLKMYSYLKGTIDEDFDSFLMNYHRFLEENF